METPAACGPVLILEDEPLIAMDIEWMLERRGVKTITVTSLAQAKTALADGKSPKIALLDVRLVDGDSFGLARQLVAAGTRVVFLTGYTHGVPLDLAICPMIAKPFAAEEVDAMLLRLGCGAD